MFSMENAPIPRTREEACSRLLEVQTFRVMHDRKVYAVSKCQLGVRLLLDVEWVGEFGRIIRMVNV